MSTDAVPMSQWPSEQRYVIPVAPGPDLVTLTIDGKEVQARRGELLIKVAPIEGEDSTMRPPWSRSPLARALM